MTSTQVEQFLQHLNDAWLSRDYATLGQLYHPDVVLLPPDAGSPLLGREAVLATYEDFHAACYVKRFTVTEQSSWPFSAPQASGAAITTMVHMRFAIDYRFSQSAPSGDTNTAPETMLQTEQGMDVYTLTQISPEHAPTIIWRAQFTL